MKVDHELKLVRAGGKDLPVFILNFNELDLEIIEGFKVEQLLLEDHQETISLVDEKGHSYITIPKHLVWIGAVMTNEAFVLSMKMPDDNGGVLGRVMMIAYPFGRILTDSGAFKASEKEVELAKLMKRGVSRNAESLLNIAQRKISSLPLPN